VLSKVRTDLDRFSDDEADALQTHGYYLADASISTWTKHLTGTDTPPTVPAPTPADEQAIRRNLSNSHKRSLIGRGQIVW
jgi:hypothetical protein